MAFPGRLAQIDTEGIGKVAERDHRLSVVVSEQGEERVEVLFGNGVLELQIPVARRFLFPPETDGPGGKMQLPLAIGHEKLPVGVFLIGILRNIGRPQEPAHLIFIAILVQNDEEGLVGVLFHVVGEVWRFLIDVEFLQDDVDTRHQVGAIASRYQRNPGIGVFRHVRIVGRNHHYFRAAVFRLGKEMGVGRAGHVDVGAGDDPIRAEIPVGALAVFRLVAKHGGRNMRQVVIPLVVAAIDAAQQIVVAVPRDETQQAHRWDR